MKLSWSQVGPGLYRNDLGILVRRCDSASRRKRWRIELPGQDAEAFPSLNYAQWYADTKLAPEVVK